MTLAQSALLTTGDDLVIGGAELIDVFFAEATRLRASRTWILVPYVERSALEGDVLRFSWNRLAAATDLRIVVRSRDAAEAVRLSLVRAARADIRIDGALHAKLFVTVSSEGSVALIGSQNLTCAALHVNVEAGVLLRGAHSTEIRRVISGLRGRAELVARTARPYTGAR